MQTQVVILAAGLGTRLGRPHPKPLTPLSSGETIMRRAVNLLRASWPDVRVTAVVGFKLDLVIEAMPDISFVYNEVYDSTNTNKSLLKALQLSHNGGVLWMNGDVV
ncbi:MAG: nucleotidyltransferase, partial [Nocardioidaceae bacterium]|nr:nucleotidyltransferase [Nocardioidaceae bacterium]